MVETWKLLVGGAVVVLTFGVVATGLNVDLSPPVVAGLLIFAVAIVAINYVLFKRSYRVGQRLGGDEEKD
jgi:hypothetical protein